MDLIKFGYNIRKLRKAKKLSQAQFEAQFGIKQTVLSSYERGRAMPSLDNALKIAECLNVSLGDLLGIDERIAQQYPSQTEAFIDIMKAVIEIMEREPRREVIESLRGVVKNIAERRGFKDIAYRMSRKTYKKTA